MPRTSRTRKPPTSAETPQPTPNAAPPTSPEPSGTVGTRHVSFAQAEISGHLGADAALRETRKDKIPFLAFDVAATKRIGGADKGRDVTVWTRVLLFDRIEEFRPQLLKGAPIFLRGSFGYDRNETDKASHVKPLVRLERCDMLHVGSRPAGPQFARLHLSGALAEPAVITETSSHVAKAALRVDAGGSVHRVDVLGPIVTEIQDRLQARHAVSLVADITHHEFEREGKTIERVSAVVAGREHTLWVNKEPLPEYEPPTRSFRTPSAEPPAPMRDAPDQDVDY